MLESVRVNDSEEDIFLGLTVLGKLPICDSLQKRFQNIRLSLNWFSQCRVSSENSSHLILQCSYAQGIWNKAINELSLQWVIPVSAADLLVDNLGSAITHQ